ncbi:MAG TPA: hypothetical protein VGU69_11075 [Rhizomicrobium sp.]|nr:hypothetical protein [Rhizomicrobium sp.]
MKYRDGQPVMVGDKVWVWPGNEGVVVASFDTNEFSKEYPESEWSYLKRGVMIKCKLAGDIHLTKPDDELVLIERSSPA